MSEPAYNSVEAWAGSTYEDADLPDVPQEPEDAPEKDPEIQSPNDYSVLLKSVEALQYQNTHIMDRLDILTGAVNQFGSMLDYIVQSVTEVGKSLSQGGLSGILSMLKGSANSD